MSHIPPVSVADMPESLSNLVEKGLNSGMLSSSIPVQVWAHRPAIALCWLELL